MIIIITGCTHTGKTLLAQKLLERYKYPYLSIDHLKMGLIRSGQTALTVEDDAGLTAYLWNIVKEIIKTVIENKQNLILEGCYVPFDWAKSFDKKYLRHIQFYCLVMSEQYIESHFEAICAHANVIEDRLNDSGLNQMELIAENKHNLAQCKKYGCKFILIHDNYPEDIEKSGIYANSVHANG